MSTSRQHKCPLNRVVVEIEWRAKIIFSAKLDLVTMKRRKEKMEKFSSMKILAWKSWMKNSNHKMWERKEWAREDENVLWAAWGWHFSCWDEEGGWGRLKLCEWKRTKQDSRHVHERDGRGVKVSNIGQKRNEKCFAPESSLNVFIEKNVGHEWIVCFGRGWQGRKYIYIHKAEERASRECERKCEWMNERYQNKSSARYPSFLSFATLSTFRPLIKSITSWI